LALDRCSFQVRPCVNPEGDGILVAAGRESSGFAEFIRRSPDGLRRSANKVSDIGLTPKSTHFEPQRVSVRAQRLGNLANPAPLASALRLKIKIRAGPIPVVRLREPMRSKSMIVIEPIAAFRNSYCAGQANLHGLENASNRTDHDSNTNQLANTTAFGFQGVLDSFVKHTFVDSIRLQVSAGLLQPSLR